ncbi:hypothetical protein G6F22_014007 [Rhizopus arrhizus]|nr:hypothetical protein G6F22_014007 [Rhizopus arrhizus]
MPGAGVDQLRKRGVHALQFGHPLRDVLQAGLGGVAHAAHVLRVTIAEREQFADLVQAEAQRFGAADEAQPAQVRLAEDAVATGRARRRRQQLLPLVVADGIDRHAGLAGQLSNVHGGFLQVLPLIVKPGVWSRVKAGPEVRIQGTLQLSS